MLLLLSEQLNPQELPKILENPGRLRRRGGNSFRWSRETPQGQIEMKELRRSTGGEQEELTGVQPPRTEPHPFKTQDEELEERGSAAGHLQTRWTAST